jgi:glycerophosphoryl diester phosphodiesterase
MTGPLVVAHRAGNSLSTLQNALARGADLVEADIHAYRGRLEVRHWKSLGPWWLWERGTIVRRRSEPLLEVADLLSAAHGHPRLLLDLKGIHPWLPSRLAAALPGTPLTVCTQHWWMLSHFHALPNVRLVLSAGSGRALRRLRARLRRRPAYGVSVHLRLLTPSIVAELQRSVSVVLTWPVDTHAELARAHDLRVDGVIGKDLDLLLPRDGSAQ